MPATTKTLILTATGVVVLGVGGYIGAQAVVGNEVEKSLFQTFTQLDDSLSWYASDVTIDKSLFKTTASATIGMEGVDNANAQVNLLVDHGVINSPVTGTIHPNEQFLRGDINIDLVASRSSITGQLTAGSLSGVELDGNLQDLVVDLDLENRDVWKVDGQAREIVINNENNSVRVVSPRFENRSQEASSLIHQYLEIPRVEFLAQGISVYMDGVELEAKSKSVGDSQIVNSGGRFKVADIGADGTSMGSLSLDMDAKNWDMPAFQALQEAYAPLEAMRAEYEETRVRGDEQEERELLIQAIESGYDVLIASPSIAFQPLEAHVTLPMLGLDFNPRITADIRFDGKELSKDALYSALWDSRLPLPDQLKASQGVMSTPEAQEYLQNRLSLDISVTTPPPMVLSLIPMPFSLLIDSDLEEQTLIWQDGSLTVNGEEVI
ncbi:DUF945 family protein [Vreelandella nanhaiensis]|uniref:DUF945 family protein n=1 Tax=Vreelandella nanhaiensis TaxID=1258546 RepID=A0A3S0W4U6_9GAMM|nr:DUF945 family protein [Halomonas nanhaiensis]RUR31683.1 DUF945 family protein [Halomonas nanhaiensis]